MDNKPDPLFLVLLAEYVAKSLSAKERDSADYYAGPDKSFPLWNDGRGIHSAWDLAGQAANKEEVRANILRFAREHGQMDKLPADATEAKGEAKKADGVREGNDPVPANHDPLLEQLLKLCWEHEANEGDTAQMQALEDWALAHNVAFTLAQDAIDSAQKAEVSKATFIAKAWPVENGTVIEGWVSTEDEDADADIVPPEAFKAQLSSYAQRRMPLSSEHNMNKYPIGHGQRIALVRDGQIFAEASHPTDPAEFAHFPATGNGVYGRFLITEPPAADAVAKGNIGGFSWYGTVRRQKRPSGKGHIFRQVDLWMECTIAAYPRNGKAVLVAAN